MGLNIVLVKAAMLLFLMGFTATVDARFNPSSFVTQLLMNGNAVTGTQYYFANSLASDACCDSCKCTRSIPPQCQCYDIRETCHSACKACFCALTYPPKCSCFDVNDFCYKSCSGAKTHKEQGMNEKVSISDVANVI